LDYAKGLENLPDLLQELPRHECASYVGADIASAESETFTGLLKLYEVLLGEIIEKRREDNVIFF
jgi:hypothetical protein